MVSAGDVDSSSWLSGVTAPPDREHSVCSSCSGRQPRKGRTGFAKSYSQVEKTITWMNSDKPQNSKTQSDSLSSSWMCKELLLLTRIVTMKFFGGFDK